MQTPRKVWRCCSFPAICRATFTTSSLWKSTVPTKPSANSSSLSQRTCLLCLHLGNPETSYSIMTMHQLEELTVSLLLEKFPAIYGTRKFLTVFTITRNLSILNYCPRLNLRPCEIFLDVVVSVFPNRQAGGPPLVACPQPLNQFILSFPPYSGAVSSIRNLRKR